MIMNKQDNTNSNPLEKLFVSESQEVNKTDLADMLFSYIAINKDTGVFEFTKNFRTLPNIEKILVVLCAVKARHLVMGTEDKIGPKEIIGMDIAPEGSIKSALKNLLDSKEIRAEKSKYFLPNYKLTQVISRLKI